MSDMSPLVAALDELEGWKMRSRRVDSIENFMDAGASSWNSVGAQSITLIPTPLGLQPTPYIKVSWKDRPYGAANRLSVASVHDGRRAAFRLQWLSASSTLAEGENFPDSAAIALVVRGDPPLMLMGGADAPIHLLLWQAGISEPRSLQATGIGSSRPGPAVGASVHAHWSNGRWSIVIARDLGSGGDIAPLEAGGSTRIGFAVWNGANKERAGIKAVSGDWSALTLDQ
jgi:DMSO reductase family type II enzyme heme b subunit